MFNGFDLSTIQDAKLGSTQINQIYYGSTLIWPTGPTPHDYSRDYLTFEALENGIILFGEDYAAGGQYLNLHIFYRVNNGQWTEIISDHPYSSDVIEVNTGDIVEIKGNNYSYSYDPNKPITGHCHFRVCCNCNISGNIMSLIYGDNFIGQTSFPDVSLCNGAFLGLFERNYNDGNYITIDNTNFLYKNIVNTNNFILPVSTLVNGCYQHMFDNCQNMVTTPQLPATTLAPNCYAGMFYNCITITTAPDLLATNLISNANGAGCYSSMFEGCSNLNYIKCLATTKVDNYDQWKYTGAWLNNVSSTGTFVKDASTTWWPVGDDVIYGITGIPANWTVQNA